MSWWDQYLAPGDVRAQNQALLKHQEKAVQAAREAKTPRSTSRTSRIPGVRVDAATRARRQNGLLLGGIFFSVFSIIITRRTITRKKIRQSRAIGARTESASPDAAHALALATLIVSSFGMLGAGIIANVFNVADIEDLRDGVRRGMGYDVYGGNEEADKELEDWVSEILSKKDGVSGLKDQVAAKLAELQKQEQDQNRPK